MILAYKNLKIINFSTRKFKNSKYLTENLVNEQSIDNRDPGEIFRFRTPNYIGSVIFIRNWISLGKKGENVAAYSCSTLGGARWFVRRITVGWSLVGGGTAFNWPPGAQGPCHRHPRADLEVLRSCLRRAWTGVSACTWRTPSSSTPWRTSWTRCRHQQDSLGRVAHPVDIRYPYSMLD